jgi:hypothetical protein
MENVDLGEIRSQRREMAEQTMRASTVAEVREILGQVFGGRATHPWFQICTDFLAEHGSEVVVRGELPDHCTFIYFPKSNRGIWYRFASSLEGIGMIGPLGLATLAELAAAKNLAP